MTNLGPIFTSIYATGHLKSSLVKKIIFLNGLVENLILGKNQEKKVSEVSRFSGYSGFAGSPVFRKIFFLIF